ncbi:MAG: hypothetical protein IVW56_14120 [Candidatus Binataceae bacterium]|nr:hypothetical protein [Candidatus Binataceae bacterium]
MRLALAAALIGVASMTGCATHLKSVLGTAATPSAQPADDTTPAGPEAKIHISYAHPGDYLATLSVIKYSAADPLTTTPGVNGTGVASIIRFDGGVPAWQIDDEKGMFSDLPIGGSKTNFAIPEVTYGNVPAHFTQSTPAGDSPEPLESDHYYVFSVTRASGSISYEAVKVNADGSLEAYAADPRAGTSFRLCCDLPADFTITAPPEAATPPSGVDSPPDSSAPPDSSSP